MSGVPPRRKIPSQIPPAPNTKSFIESSETKTSSNKPPTYTQTRNMKLIKIQDSDNTNKLIQDQNNEEKHILRAGASLYRVRRKIPKNSPMKISLVEPPCDTLSQVHKSVVESSQVKMSSVEPSETKTNSTESFIESSETKTSSTKAPKPTYTRNMNLIKIKDSDNANIGIKNQNNEKKNTLRAGASLYRVRRKIPKNSPMKISLVEPPCDSSTQVDTSVVVQVDKKVSPRKKTKKSPRKKMHTEPPSDILITRSSRSTQTRNMNLLDSHDSDNFNIFIQNQNDQETHTVRNVRRPRKKKLKGSPRRRLRHYDKRVAPPTLITVQQKSERNHLIYTIGSLEVCFLIFFVTSILGLILGTSALVYLNLLNKF